MKIALQFTRLASVLMIALSSAPCRAETSATSTKGQTQSKDDPELILRTSDIVNAKVFSDQGAELGHIRDALFDRDTGQISHVVVGIGGWQGIGEKYAIVPWNMVKQDEQKAGNYVIQTDFDKFKNAPTFERAQWATVIQPEYLAKVQKYFATPSPSQQAKSQQVTPPTPPTTQESQQSKSQSGSQQTAKTESEQRPRKELQIQQRSRQSSGSHGRVGTDDESKKGGSHDDDGK